MPIELPPYHLAQAPEADTGQAALAVRVISQLGAGSGGSGGGPVALDAATLAALETINVGNFPATQPISGTVAVSNFPGTQPISGTVALDGATLAALETITASGPLTDAQLRANPVPVGLDSASLSALETISVANFPSSQPVTGPLTDAQLRASNVPVSGPLTNTELRASPIPTSVSNFPASQVVEHKPNTLIVTGTAAAGVAVTATLPAAGAGQFHYITLIQIVKYASAAITGTATPVVVTSTNLPGNPAFTFPTAQAIGTIVEQKFDPTNAVKSTAANTATTIVCPAVTNTIWRINVFYYTGP